MQAAALQLELSVGIAALTGARALGWQRQLDNRDGVTGLPNRRGRAGLLAAEQALSTPVGDPVGLALVDLGVLRSARTLRRAVDMVRDAAGGVQMARVGPRQLGLLAGGLQTAEVRQIADLAQARLEGAGFRASTAPTMRAGVEQLAATWSRAEAALVTARRPSSARL